jgi:hypothetical protein
MENSEVQKFVNMKTFFENTQNVKIKKKSMETTENIENPQVRTVLCFNLFSQIPKFFEILKFRKY